MRDRARAFRDHSSRSTARASRATATDRHLILNALDARLTHRARERATRTTDFAYSTIRDEGANCPVLVYVSTADVDALCAFRTLKLMLRSDNVAYSVFPVSGYGELQRLGEEIPDDGQQRAIVLINCGGTEDVKTVMGLREGARAYVFDSHRPLDLENTRADNQDVLVMRDDKEGEESFPEPDSEDDSDSDDDDDEDDDAGAKGGESPRTRRLRKAEKQRERAAYYARGSFYGRSSGMVMYDIAYRMSKDRLENYLPLWLAVLSMTDQYLHQRLSHEMYTSCVMELATRVSAMSNADMPTTRSLEDGTIVKAFDERRLQYNEEFRFMLLRHWTLYESMLHSNYVATQLQTWTERGRANLNSLFAHVGIPLDVAKQKYSHMSPAQVKQFEERLDEYGASHGLDNVKFWSFQYSHGYALRVCAADVVYGATALLEGMLDREEEDRTPADNFWRASQALSLGNWDEMEAGISHAIRLQQAVMRQGGIALASSAHIRTTGSLRCFSLLDHGSPADVKLFMHPLSLLKLALFVQDALRVTKKRLRPLVCIGPSAEDESLALIVGVTAKPNTDDAAGGNFFTHSFKMAAERIHARFRHDSFEASVIQVARRDLGPFIEALSDIDAERLARLRMAAE